MTSDRCPKDDPLHKMNPNDVFEVACPQCGMEVEFIGNEERRKCAACGESIANPKLTGDSAK